jgi:bifunctional UDP-N-acetylglucosamine pyrophosphorylase/glucosamine-1-phosphate N-acetyltransferase
MEPARPVGVVILAAGKGTRMKSRLPKVAHHVAGRPMLELVLRAAAEAVAGPAGPADESGEPASDAEDHSRQQRNATRYVVVVGHERDTVRSALRWSPPDVAFVVQEPQLGTGDAVRTVRDALVQPPKPETILVLYGDTPLLRAATIRGLLDEHEKSGAVLTFLTGIADRPTDYGRILRDANGRVAGIVEARHATPEQFAIAEVNSGIYCFRADWLWSRLDHLQPHENGEYYLTDLVVVAVRERKPVATLSAPLDETSGVNDRVQLEEAGQILRRRILRDLMRSGVTVEDVATTYVEPGVRVGQDSVLRPGTHLEGATAIGERCVIGPNSVVRDSSIGDECRVLASWVEEAVMEPRSRVGPMSHLRPGARLASGAHVGNFAEVKNATLGETVQQHHFSYIGDATIGARTNVAAGVITSNFALDGKKYHTQIGEDVFLGTDTMLRAPLVIGDGAVTGSGSVVTRDVPPGGVAVGMPARVIKYRELPERRGQPPSSASQPSAPDATAPGSAQLAPNVPRNATGPTSESRRESEPDSSSRHADDTAGHRGEERE